MRAVYDIGHSNRTLEFFVGLLLGYQVEHLVDVRTVPRSRHNPQFNRETLPADLKNVGIAYTPPCRGWAGCVMRERIPSIRVGKIQASGVRGHQEEFIGTSFCTGQEGNPDEPKPHPSCATRFEIQATLRFK